MFETAAEILHDESIAPSTSALSDQMPDTNMDSSPESPTISVASLFEDDTAVPAPTSKSNSEGCAKVTVTEEELTEAAVRCSISSDSSTVSEQQVERPRNKKRDFMTLRVSSAPRAMTTSGSSSHEKMSVMKSTLRKRRRSASASGIGAMLLKVVRVPESGTIVTRKFVGSPETSAALPAEDSPWRSFSVEKTAASPIEPAASCETDLSDDAVS